MVDSFIGVPPLVSRRVLETLTYLARHHPYVAKILLQFSLPLPSLEEQVHTDQARGKAAIFSEEHEINKKQNQGGYISIELLLSLLNQPLYLRSIAHLEQVIHFFLFDILVILYCQFLLIYVSLKFLFWPFFSCLIYWMSSYVVLKANLAHLTNLMHLLLNIEMYFNFLCRMLQLVWTIVIFLLGLVHHPGWHQLLVQKANVMLKAYCLTCLNMSFSFFAHCLLGKGMMNICIC